MAVKFDSKPRNQPIPIPVWVLSGNIFSSKSIAHVVCFILILTRSDHRAAKWFHGFRQQRYKLMKTDNIMTLFLILDVLIKILLLLESLL